MRNLYLCCSVTAFLLTGCKDTAEGPTNIVLPSRIVHTQGRGIPEQVDLYIIERAGTNRKLADSVGINNYATWSADGTHIVFQGNRGRPTEIYVVNTDGSAEVNISNSPAIDEHPTWSSDGSMVLFESNRNGDIDLWLTDIHGLNLVDLTSFPLRDSQASWSHAGNKIAYVGRRSGNLEIYITNTSGQDHTNITMTPVLDERAPAWSPNDSTIAYILNGQLHMIRADGSIHRQLTSVSDSVANSQPQWSPDGKNILFETVGNEIYRIGADGTGISNLTSNPAIDKYPRWSPDGQWVAFESYRNAGVDQIFVMRPDGSGLQQVTSDPNGAAMPEWSPQ